MFSSKIYLFSYTKNKSKEFYCRCYVLSFSYTSRFSFFLLFNVFSVSGIVLVLLWFRIIGKTIKTLGFNNNAHTFARPVKCRCVIHRHIQNPVKHQKERLLAVNYFRKILHFRYLRGLWICLWHLWNLVDVASITYILEKYLLRSWFLLKLSVYSPQCYLKSEPPQGFKDTIFWTVFNVNFYMTLIMLFYV